MTSSIDSPQYQFLAAAKAGDCLELRRLYQAHPEQIDIDARLYGKTPMEAAVQMADSGICLETLEELGATLQENLLCFATTVRMIDYLARRDLSINAYSKIGARTPLIAASVGTPGCDPMVDRIRRVLELGALPSGTNYFGRNALHFYGLTTGPKLEVVQALVEGKVPLNHIDDTDRSPLDYFRLYPEIRQYLSDQGAHFHRDVEMTDIS